MIDVRSDTIIYQSQLYYTNLVNTLVDKRKLGKALDSEWRKADTIREYLRAYNFLDRLYTTADITNSNYILDCLIRLCELNQYPVSNPLTIEPIPSIITGAKGDKGDKGDTGDTGATGLATDIQTGPHAASTNIDSFLLSDAIACRWDYVVTESGGAQRAGSIIATWDTIGSLISMQDTSTPDISSDTSGIEFDVTYSIGNINLAVVITTGSWNIKATRYFIPNNGNGAGPVSDVLADGKVFIGNSSNVATARTLSGAITVTNTGVTSISNDYITNVMVNSSAAIDLTKLAVMTASRAVVSDASGFLTPSAVTATELSYLSGVTSAIQTQIAAKMTNPMTTLGDVIYGGALGVPTRLAVGSNGDVLTLTGGVPTWSAPAGGISGLSTGSIPKASSSTTLNDSIISQSGSAITIAGTAEIQSGFRTQATGSYYKVKVLDIGDWNMDSTSSVSVLHGLADYKKIRGVSMIVVRDDSDTNYYSLPFFNSSTSENGGVTGITSTTVNVGRLTGGVFDNTSFDSTSFNRGWITIIYEA